MFIHNTALQNYMSNDNLSWPDDFFKSNFFNFKFNIVPFFRTNHWLLVIIEFSDERDLVNQAPISAIIRIFDSKLSLNYKDVCKNIVHNFLIQIVNQVFGSSNINVVIDEKCQFVETIQGENNSWDCGPFTIYHFYKFFTTILNVKSKIRLPTDPKSIGPFIRKLVTQKYNISPVNSTFTSPSEIVYVNKLKKE